jgi:hypothetical protein
MQQLVDRIKSIDRTSRTINARTHARTYLRVHHVLQARKVHLRRPRHAPVRRGLPAVGAPVRMARPARCPLVRRLLLVLLLLVGRLLRLLLLEGPRIKDADSAAAAAPIWLLVLRGRWWVAPLWLLLVVLVVHDWLLPVVCVGMEWELVSG